MLKTGAGAGAGSVLCKAGAAAGSALGLAGAGGGPDTLPEPDLTCPGVQPAAGSAGVDIFSGSGRRSSSAATTVSAKSSSFHATAAGVDERRGRAALAEQPADGAAGGRVQHRGGKRAMRRGA